jgi:hypothetical protein
MARPSSNAATTLSTTPLATAPMATTTESHAGASRWRPDRRVAAAVAVLLLTALVFAAWPREDNYTVDPRSREARRAVAVAQGVVPGRVIEVTRDQDSGKWEIVIEQGEREYEVELDPKDLSLLRLDYD